MTGQRQGPGRGPGPDGPDAPRCECGDDAEGGAATAGLESRSSDRAQRCRCRRESHRFGAHLRPPPLWPRDGGGTEWRLHKDGHRDDVPRSRAARGTGSVLWRWQPLAVLLLVGRLLPASAAGASAAPGAAPVNAPGLGLTAATIPPLPPMPQLPVGSYRPVSATAPQSLVTQMMDKLDKLDERLRVVTDMQWEIRYKVDTLERRLADTDSKVDRRLGEVDAALGRRLDKLSEAVTAHDHKDSGAKEQLGRKVDNVYERVVFMENNSIHKLQQAVADKAAELQRAASQAVAKSRDELTTRLAAVQAQLNATHGHVLNATRTTQDDAEESEAGQRACVDASDTAAKTIKQHIDTKTDLMSSKVSKLYNDMWRRVNELESTVKTVISLSNATRRDVQALNVAALGSQQGRGYHARQPAQESGLEYALNLHDDAVGRQLSALRDTLLDELRHVQALQDTFLNTCNRLSDKDLDVEDKLGRVLTHHTGYLLEHRGALNDLKRQLKTHSSMAARAAANATEGAKRLESAVRGLAEEGRVESRKALARLLDVAAAVQNATERASSGCGVALGPVEEEAAWTALLQHSNESEATDRPETAPDETLSATARTPSAKPTAEEGAARAAPPSPSRESTTPAASADSGEQLLLVDSNGLQRQPRREAAQEAAAAGPADSGRDANGLGRGKAQTDGAASPALVAATGSGQDSVTDLSSVDDDDYTEENDDETDFID